MLRSIRTTAIVAGWCLALIAASCSSGSNSAGPNSGTVTPDTNAAGASSGPGTGAGAGDGVVLPDGRLVRPAGSRYNLGDFALGVAVSPDGRLAVSASNTRGNGLGGGKGSYCTDTGTTSGCPWVPKDKLGDPMQPVPDESLSVVDLETGKTTDVVAVPTVRDPKNQVYNYFSLGLSFSPDGRHLYATGGGNDAVYDFGVASNALTPQPKTLVLPSKVTAMGEQPIIGKTSGYTKGLAVSRDGKVVFAVKEYDSDVTIIDATTWTVRQTISLDKATPVFGGYAYGVDVSPDGKHAYVSAQGTGDVYVLSADADGQWSKTGQVKAGDHPTAVAVSPDGSQLAVANANDDSLSIIDTAKNESKANVVLHAVDNETWGSIPNAVAFAKDGKRIFVALAGDDSVAVLDIDGAGAWKVSGYIPTGWYPAGVAVHPNGDVLIASAKGLGSRYPQGGLFPQPAPGNGPQSLPVASISLDTNIPGLLTRVPNPDQSTLADYTRKVRENISYVTKDLHRPDNSPVPAKAGDPTPIKHVVYIVRENRTFDQVFGDLGKTRKDADGDPSMEFLAAATPNAHKIQTIGSTSDRFFSNGEASIQGHWWTAAAAVSDYTEKSWRQNYSNRGKPYDFVVPIAQTRGCTVFDAAQEKADKNSAFTFRDYGEPIGFLAIPTVPALAGNGQPVAPCPQMKRENFSTPFLTEITNVVRDDRIRVKDFLADAGLDENGKPAGDQATHYLRNFSYLTMPQDHTTGLGGTHTPRAQIAQNDAALGTVVQAISHSSYWKDTAIVVVEDDSSDGTDHVDGHRNILLVASPYAKHVGEDGSTPGFVSHQHIDQPSVVHTIGLLMGWSPISSFDQLSLPLYDLFKADNDPNKLTPADLAPYDAAPPPSFIEELSADYKKPNAAQLRAISAKLDYRGVDRAGAANEAILWQTIRDDPLPTELKDRVDQQRSGAPSATTGTTGNTGAIAATDDESDGIKALCAVYPDNAACDRPKDGPTTIPGLGEK